MGKASYLTLTAMALLIVAVMSTNLILGHINRDLNRQIQTFQIRANQENNLLQTTGRKLVLMIAQQSRQDPELKALLEKYNLSVQFNETGKQP